MKIITATQPAAYHVKRSSKASLVLLMSLLVSLHYLKEDKGLIKPRMDDVAIPWSSNPAL